MKRIFTVAVVLLSLSVVARADDASKQAKAEKLIAVMHMDRMMDQMVDMMKAQSGQLIAGVVSSTEMNDQQKKLMDEFQTKIIDLTMKDVKTTMMPQMAGVYAKSFTEDELDAMYTFYASPTGQAVIEKMPQVMQNSMAMSQGMMTELMPQIKDLADEYGAKIKAAGSAGAAKS